MSVVRAEGLARVEMTVATEAGFTATNSNQWFKLLTDLGVANLQIRGATGNERIGIETAGTSAAPVYKVSAFLSARDELQVPGGRFSARDRTGLAAWLERLREEGPARAGGAPRLPFGLTAEASERVHRDLARQIDFSTQGAARLATLEKIAGRLAHPLLAETAQRATLAGSPPIDDELEGLSAGTVLAIVLHDSGLVLVPRWNAQRKAEYALAASRTATESWPIGRPWTKPEHEAVPKLLDKLAVEIDAIPVAEIVTAIGPRLAVPVIYDHVALRKRSIDPQGVVASVPARETLYSTVLRQVLARAALKYQVRVDEAGKPFIWITTQVPV